MRHHLAPLFLATTLVVAVLALLPTPSRDTAEADPAPDDFLPGEVLVAVRGDVRSASLLPALQDHAARFLATRAGGTSRAPAAPLRLVRELDFPTRRGMPRRWLRLEVDALGADAEGTRQLANEMRGHPLVEHAEVNARAYPLQSPPNDPYYWSSGSWGQDFADLWGVHNVQAVAAWSVTRGAGVTVAVLDTGVDFDHEDLAPNIWTNPGETGTDAGGQDRRNNGVDDDGNGYVDDWRGWLFSATAPSNDPTDQNGHGTHVAGTVAAVADNGLGIVGVAPDARVMALRVLGWPSGSVADVAEAVRYAAANGAHVINMSLSVNVPSPQVLIDAVDYAHDTKDVVVVAAAGNAPFDLGLQGRDGLAPANLLDAITVSAFDHADAIASFSSFGAKVDVGAPGGGAEDPSGLIPLPAYSVLSLRAAAVPETSLFAVGDNYLRLAGTSMSAPHVAGAAALVRAAYPSFTAEQVRQALRASADDVGSPGFDLQSGYGRLNVSRAVAVSEVAGLQLTGPLGVVDSLVEIDARGRVEGAAVVDWRLEHGIGQLPDEWTLLGVGTGPVDEDVLGRWDPAQASTEGSNTLRLLGRTRSGQELEDRLEVVIDAVRITEPSPETAGAFGAGSSVTVRGFVDVAGFSHFTFAVRGVRTGWVEDPVFTLTGGGQEPVADGALGTWDPAGLPADHYEIVLSVTLESGVVLEESVGVIYDPTLHPGWPVDLGPINFGSFDHLTAADVDGDGRDDLVLAVAGAVHVLRHDGTAASGWPVSGSFQHGPAVADLDGDGSPEVVAVGSLGADNPVFVWDRHGVLRPGWPRTPLRFLRYVSLADLEGDGPLEVIVSGSDGIAALDASGALLPGWPRPLSRSTAPAVGDLDGDRLPEIVVAETEGPTRLFVLDTAGQVRPGWPQDIKNHGYVYSGEPHPVLGDLNEDGEREIVFVGPDEKVRAFHHDGRPVEGWWRSTHRWMNNAPALGDLDGDGLLEAVAATETYRSQGSRFGLLLGWPVDIDGVSRTLRVGSLRWYERQGIRASFNAPVLADVDGDRRVDAVVVDNAHRAEDPYAVHAYGADGKTLPGFPKPTPSASTLGSNTVAVADLDGDGLWELAWMDTWGQVFVWDLPARARHARDWRMFQQDPAHTGVAVDVFRAPRRPSIPAAAGDPARRE